MEAAYWRPPYEKRLIRDAVRHGQPLPIANPVFVDVDTGDPAAACRSQVDGRPTRAASDFQHVAVLAHPNLVGEPKPLVRG